MIIQGPTWMYHRTRRPALVTTQAELAALGDGWADTPAAFYDPPEASDVAETPILALSMVVDDAMTPTEATHQELPESPPCEAPPTPDPEPPHLMIEAPFKPRRGRPRTSRRGSE